MPKPSLSELLKKKAKFRVGDRVKFRHGWPGVIAEVVEDRGPLGIDGERIYHVRIVLDEWNTIEPGYSESDLDLA